jgi:hypothetical protein
MRPPCARKILAIEHDSDGKHLVLHHRRPVPARSGHGKVTLFTASDGLTEGFTVNSSATGADGVLYFGGVHGMTAVVPANVKTSSCPPQVAITDITVFNHSLQDGQPAENVKAEGPVTAPTALTLSAQASVFSLEFAALHYTEPSLNRYSYQLQGFDRDWVETDAAHRSASYTNLNPGRIRSASRRPTIWACGTRTGHAGSHDHAAVLAALVVPFRPDRAGGRHAGCWRTRPASTA